MKRNTELLMAARWVQRAFGLALREIGERYRLTRIEMSIVSFLQNNPGRDTASDITELRGFSKAAVSQGIDRLCRRSLLERRPDGADRRVVHLRLTEEAGPVRAEIAAARGDFLARCFAGFSEDEIDRFLSDTDRILANLRLGGPEGGADGDDGG